MKFIQKRRAEMRHRRQQLERTDLIGKILKIAGDYRKGEIATFDAKHVEKWVEQFPVSNDHKNVILCEMGHMLEKFYISRDCAKDNLIRMFNSVKGEKVGGCSIKNVNFLRTQEQGKSQHAILLLADEILQETYGVGTQDCGGSNVYLYLDDCIYSGNKWRYDIKNSTQFASAKNGLKLISFHFAMYSAGFQYAKNYVDNYAAQKDGAVRAFRVDWLNNQCFGGETLDVLWPVYAKGNKHIDAYVQYLNAFCASRGWAPRQIFRTNQTDSSNVFTSSANRNIVEQAFLAVGAKLFCAAQNPAPSMRPMGFEVIATIGFGTPIVTWRNIANNCPLALWYGDPSYGPNHPLGMWYPLFPRKM